MKTKPKKRKLRKSQINWDRAIAKTKVPFPKEPPRCLPTPWGPIDLGKSRLIRAGDPAGCVALLSQLDHGFRLRSGDVIVIL